MSSKINEKIISSTEELIQLKLKDIMLNLIIDMCDLHLSKPETEIPSEISAHIDRVKSYAQRLTEILSKDLSEREDYIAQLKALRSEYSQSCMSIFLYVNLLNKAGNYGMWQYQCRCAEKTPADDYELVEQRIRDYIDEFIASAEDDIERYNNMSKIISLIPLRMPRERFNELAAVGLRKITESTSLSDAKFAVKMLKTGYYPILTEEYGTMLPEMKKVVEELYTRAVDKLTGEELEDYLGEIDTAMSTVEELTDYLNIAYNDINYLIALSSLCVDEEYLIDNNMLLKDVLYSCMDMLESGDYDLYAEALSEKTVDEIEEHFHELIEKDRELSEYVKRYVGTKNMSDEAMSIVMKYIHIKTLYAAELVHEIANQESPEDDTAPVDEGALKELTDELISFISSVPGNISAAKNKFLRRDFFTVMPAVMSESDFNAYLDYALEPLRGKSTGIAAITEICSLLVDEGVIPDEYEDDDEVCECGHHHHDHDHEHEHEHEHEHSHLHIVHDHE